MRLSDEARIDAVFDLADAHTAGAFVLTVESAGQATKSGRSRNPDYLALLRELLSRSAGIGGVLEDALVSSRAVEAMPLEDRRIHVEGRPFPIALVAGDDQSQLALGLTRPQADIGTNRTSRSGGNRRKRMSMHVQFPDDIDTELLVSTLGAVPVDAPDSARTPAEIGRRRAPAAERPARQRLSVEHVEGALGERSSTGDTIFLARHERTSDFDYRLLVDDETLDATAVVVCAWTHAGHPVPSDWRGSRGTVVTPLRALGYAVDTPGRPYEGVLGGDPARYADLAARLGRTDKAISRLERTEQGYLRGALGIGTPDPDALARCALCGEVLPQKLLVAAHIKPRKWCTHTERLDVPNVAWPLCALGCDALFERGYVGVNGDGAVVAMAQPGHAPGLAAAIAARVGRQILGWTPARGRYFTAHREGHSGRGFDTATSECE